MLACSVHRPIGHRGRGPPTWSRADAGLGLDDVSPTFNGVTDDGRLRNAVADTNLANHIIYATADEAVAYMFYRCFFLFFVFFPSTKTMRQPFSGTAERIFMKLLPNDTGKHVV